MFFIAQSNYRSVFKLQMKIFKGISLLYYFSTVDFKFHTPKLIQLYDDLDDNDKEIFRFDHRAGDQEELTILSFMGVRQFLLNEGPETIPNAQTKLRRLRVANDVVQLFFGSICCAIMLMFLYG